MQNNFKMSGNLCFWLVKISYSMLLTDVYFDYLSFAFQIWINNLPWSLSNCLFQIFLLIIKASKCSILKQWDWFCREWHHSCEIMSHLYKENLAHKEICSSDWLKPPTSTLLAHIPFASLLSFLCFTFQIWLCIKEAYLHLKCR